MKPFFKWICIGGLFLTGCEEEPVIQLPGFETRPIIFSVLDTRDTSHYIRVGRLFSGIAKPSETSRAADSIYFNQVEVTLRLLDFRNRWMEVPVKPVIHEGKETGYFNSDPYIIYRFDQLLQEGEDLFEFLKFKKASMTLDAPGSATARCSTLLVTPPKIYAPMRAQKYITITPEIPLRIVWTGDAWNEMDLIYDIVRIFADSSVTETFSIQKFNDVFINGKYYEIKVPYDFMVEQLLRNLKVNNQSVRTCFGDFTIHIETGNPDFQQYMQYKGGINDFNFNPFSNIENGLGVFCSKSSLVKTHMKLDQESRLYFAADARLRKYNWIEY